MPKPSLSLTEFNNLLRDIIEANFPDELWIVAEISELNVNARGHCYIDFIERDALSGKINARQRATVWAFQYQLVRDHFEGVTGQELVPGLKVLVNVRINYHVLYGLSLNVVDIDPTYTIGDQARHREQILARLEEEGVLDMNQQTDMAEVPQRIAVISSETAAGYGDFVEHLINNPAKYNFQVDLFSSVMQGDRTSISVVAALDAIYQREDDFDVVLIIRGGGARSELVAFDDYEMAFMISQSPIPVLTGIGHERDQSVADLVAWHAFKTPTAVADFLLDRCASFEQKINDLANQSQMLVQNAVEQHRSNIDKQQLILLSSAKSYVDAKNYSLQRQSQKMVYIFKQQLQESKSTLRSLSNNTQQVVLLYNERKVMHFDKFHSQLAFVTHNYFSNQYHDLAIKQEVAQGYSPSRILKSGYGYVTKEGKRVSNVSHVQQGDLIKIAFVDGIVQGGVTNVEGKEFI